MSSGLPEFRALDCGFSRPKRPDLSARAILRMSRRRGESRTLASHCFPFIDSERTLEAEWSGVLVRRFREKYVDSGEYEWCVWRPVFLTPAAAERGVAKAREINGRGYGFAKLALQGVDLGVGMVTGRDVWLARRLGLFSDRYVICSWTLGVVGHVAGLWWPRKSAWAKQANPDELLDFIMSDRMDDVRFAPGAQACFELVAQSDGWAG
jgi:hypothetical protein